MMEPEQKQQHRLLADCTGLPVTCGSEEGLKWYNKSIVAFLTFREPPLPLATKASELDHTMPLAHCVAGTLQLLYMSQLKAAPHVSAVKSVDLNKITEREKSHVKAFLIYASGNLPQAMEEWISILVEYPHDIFAINAAFRGCLYLGQFQKQRDLLARVLPHWNEDMVLYPFIISLYAFSLEQNNQRDRAEELARKALSMEVNVPWAYHSLSHVIEEERDVNEGVKFLTSTWSEWCDCVLGAHIGWHLILYYLDLNNMTEALQVFDRLLIKPVCEGNVLALIDSSSFLWRLNLMGIDPGEGRWEKVMEGCMKWKDNHNSAYFDIHIVMSLVHGKVSESAARMALARQMIESVEAHAQTDSALVSGPGVPAKLGVPICNALLAFGEEKYDEVLSIVLPLRYDLVRFGSSWAQRQVCSLTVIEAAVRAKKVPLALALVAELKAQKPRSQHLSRLFDELRSSYNRQKYSKEPDVKRV